MELSNKQKARILDIIGEPVHECGKYDELHIFGLFKKIEEILTKFEKDELGLQNSDVVEKINNYLKSNVSVRHQYFSFMGDCNFDCEEIYYRTAYAALYDHEAMCAGYTEAVRCLLAAFDVESYTLVSKLPGANKQLLHYVCVVCDGDECRVVDSERESSCERRGYDFQKYLDGMTFIIPGLDFANEKIGNTGVGIKANDYLERSTTISCCGVSGILELIKIMRERENGELQSNKRK